MMPLPIRIMLACLTLFIITIGVLVERDLKIIRTGDIFDKIVLLLFVALAGMAAIAVVFAP